MNKFIDHNELLQDIKSSEARVNFDIMVNYLCSSPVPDKVEELIELSDGTLEENHEYLANILYSKDNYNLASDVLKNRSQIGDSDIDNGFASVYDLNKNIILKLDSQKYYRSVSVLEHELTHLLQALNNNNPKKQYNEFLSFFAEILSIELLSQKYNNPNIYKNSIINRLIARMSYRVYTIYFEDEYIEHASDLIKQCLMNWYPYMLGLIYAIRLLELYHISPSEIIDKFNCVLSGKKSVDKLLKEYNISLEDESTVLSFKNMCDLYREFVMEKYDKSDVHYVR